MRVKKLTSHTIKTAQIVDRGVERTLDCLLQQLLALAFVSLHLGIQERYSEIYQSNLLDRLRIGVERETINAIDARIWHRNEAVALRVLIIVFPRLQKRLIIEQWRESF